MALILAGVSYRTAPIDVRERLAISARDAPLVLAAIRAETLAPEAVLLSTCNRTEVYVVEGEQDAVAGVWSVLGRRLGSDVSVHGYVRRDREAVAHLYRVAAGVDSMILGEAQIHGQVRDAWESSRASSGAALSRLFQSALLVASRVRNETAIGRGAASVSSASVQLARKIFGSLQGRSAMVLGAGDMAALALECLVDEGVRAAVVANRTYERAAALAERYGAEALHYDDCWARLSRVDVLLCSTSSRHPVVERRHIEPAVRERGDAPLCILDIALPRDVAPDVAALPNVFLYDLDDLQAVVAANLERRQGELPLAERVIAAEVEQYWSWLAGLAAVPVVKSLRSRMDRVREEELAHALRRLGHLPQGDREAIEHFSRALMNKFLHEPSQRLRAAAANGRGLAVVDALRYLFDLDGAAAPGDAPRDDDREAR